MQAEQLQIEFAKALQEITPSSVPLAVNPNCFFDFEMDVDPGMVEKDEGSARDLAVFLWDEFLPLLTQQVRLGQIIPMSGPQLSDLLHSFGINIRYLGRLARLARVEEQEDETLLQQGQRRNHCMPPYWVDILETEMVARCVKSIVNNILQASRPTRSAPAKLLASLLSHCLGSEDMLCGLCDSDSTDATTKSKKKKGNKATGANSVPVIVEKAVPELSTSTLSRQDFWKQLKSLLSERFSYDLNLILVSKSAGRGAGLSTRIDRIVLLRRIAQQCGIRYLTHAIFARKQCYQSTSQCCYY